MNIQHLDSVISLSKDLFFNVIRYLNYSVIVDLLKLRNEIKEIYSNPLVRPIIENHHKRLIQKVLNLPVYTILEILDFSMMKSTQFYERAIYHINKNEDTDYLLINKRQIKRDFKQLFLILSIENQIEILSIMKSRYDRHKSQMKEIKQSLNYLNYRDRYRIIKSISMNEYLFSSYNNLSLILFICSISSKDRERTLFIIRKIDIDEMKEIDNLLKTLSSENLNLLIHILHPSYLSNKLRSSNRIKVEFILDSLCRKETSRCKELLFWLLKDDYRNLNRIDSLKCSLIQELNEISFIHLCDLQEKQRLYLNEVQILLKKNALLFLISEITNDEKKEIIISTCNVLLNNYGDSLILECNQQYKEIMNEFQLKYNQDNEYSYKQDQENNEDDSDLLFNTTYKRRRIIE